MTDTPDIVTLDQLARRLRLSRAWLHREARAGRIPSLKAGKATRFNPVAVSAVLAERAATGAASSEGSAAR